MSNQNPITLMEKEVKAYKDLKKPIQEIKKIVGDLEGSEATTIRVYEFLNEHLEEIKPESHSFDAGDDI